MENIFLVYMWLYLSERKLRSLCGRACASAVRVRLVYEYAVYAMYVTLFVYRSHAHTIIHTGEISSYVWNALVCSRSRSLPIVCLLVEFESSCNTQVSDSCFLVFFRLFRTRFSQSSVRLGSLFYVLIPTPNTVRAVVYLRFHKLHYCLITDRSVLAQRRHEVSSVSFI